MVHVKSTLVIGDRLTFAFALGEITIAVDTINKKSLNFVRTSYDVRTLKPVCAVLYV